MQRDLLQDVKLTGPKHLKALTPISPILIWTYKTQVDDFTYDSDISKCWFSSSQTARPCQGVVTILLGCILSYSHGIPILPREPLYQLDPSLPSLAAHLRNPQATAFLGALRRLHKDGTSALAPDVASGPIETLLHQVWDLVHPTNG